MVRMFHVLGIFYALRVVFHVTVGAVLKIGMVVEINNLLVFVEILASEMFTFGVERGIMVCVREVVGYVYRPGVVRTLFVRVHGVVMITRV